MYTRRSAHMSMDTHMDIPHGIGYIAATVLCWVTRDVREGHGSLAGLRFEVSDTAGVEDMPHRSQERRTPTAKPTVQLPTQNNLSARGFEVPAVLK